MTGEPQKIPPAGMSLAVSPYRFNTLLAAGRNQESELSGAGALVGRSAGAENLTKRSCSTNAVKLFQRRWPIIFWVKDGTLHTPALSTGAIAGITRGAVIELAEKQFIPVIEGVYELGDLTEADEIFLTSASLGVALVTTFDFRQYSAATANICARLSDAFKDLTSQSELRSAI